MQCPKCSGPLANAGIFQPGASFNFSICIPCGALYQQGNRFGDEADCLLRYPPNADETRCPDTGVLPHFLTSP